jgi:hypothetical protein
MSLTEEEVWSEDRYSPRSKMGRRAICLKVLSLLAGGAVDSKLSALRASGPESQESFDRLFSDLQTSPSEIQSVLGYREFRWFPFSPGVERAPSTARPSNLLISSKATDLIVFFEVSGKATYNARYERPTRPAGESGVTIGIGYDIGYSTPSSLKADWSDFIEASDLATLTKLCGVTGARAGGRLATVQDVKIPWDTAMRQFVGSEQAKYVGLTERSLPNFAKLSNNSRGALVSLVYNRGPSFNVTEKADPTGRYLEMRKIHSLMERDDFGAIPAEIKSMSRIWVSDPNLKGLVIRRSLEAALFQSGLA